MQHIWCDVAVLTVAMIFYLWRAHAQVTLRRRRRLSERVAWMLWVVALRIEPCGELVEVD
jgi:hypothetical protein